jgi:hypothetical protein
MTTCTPCVCSTRSSGLRQLGSVDVAWSMQVAVEEKEAALQKALSRADGYEASGCTRGILVLGVF